MTFRNIDSISRRRFSSCLLSLTAFNLSHFAPASPRFQTFDALLHYNKPDLRTYGMPRISAVANIWRKNATHDLVDLEGIELALNALPIGTDMIFVDIEEWPVLQTSAVVRNAAINKFVNVAEIIRTLRPSIKFGFYNVVPAHTYWPLVTSQFPEELREWNLVNQELRVVAELVDVIFPSLYTYYANSNEWRSYASRLIDAARIYNKPVYPFLWFEYHDSNAELVNKEIDPMAWRKELQLCKEQADGVVLWGGYRHRWNNDAIWWQIACNELGLNAGQA